MQRDLKTDMDFLYKNPRIEIGNDYLTHDYLNLVRNKIINFSKKNKKFSIIIRRESIKNIELYSSYVKILEYLNNSGNEVYLSMTITTSGKYLLHPLCSAIFYKNDHWLYNYNNEFFLKENKKINKAHISVRRRNEERFMFFKKYNKKFDGIFRYLDYDLNIKNKSNLQKSISNTELLDEIKKTYIYFCFETSTIDYVNSFTEKSLITFLCQSLPIMFLKNKTHLEELENMGFYLLNREMGYIGIEGTLENKVDEFIKCVDRCNKMKIEDVNKIYIKNYSKIMNNYNIISNIYFSNKKLNNNGCLFLTKKPI